jgi:hypothetical protein
MGKMYDHERIAAATLYKRNMGVKYCGNLKVMSSPIAGTERRNNASSKLIFLVAFGSKGW